MEDKKTIKFSAIDFPSHNIQGINSEYFVRGKNDYVTWGKDNKFPEFLYDLYLNCATLQSILNGSIKFTQGNEIINNTPIKEENIFGDTIEDIVRKVIVDLWIFGGTFLEIKYNKLGEVIGVKHLDPIDCRTNKDCDSFFINSTFGQWTNKYAKKLNCFDPDTAAEHGIQVFYYKGQLSKGCYPIPDYFAAIISAQIQIAIQNFQINEVKNNFLGSWIISFNNGEPEEEVKQYIERKIKDKFGGEHNAGGVMISWNEDKEHGLELIRLATDDLDTRYQSTAESSRENLFISMSAHPQLFGLPVSSGFAAIEYGEAFNLYNRTQIIPKQDEVTKIFNKIFGIENSIEFKPFDLNTNVSDDSIKEIESIPSDLLQDLTVNERRELIGYDEIPDTDANTISLAERLGVGWLQSLIEVLNNPELSDEKKRGILEAVFEFTPDQINKMIPRTL